MRISDWSSDVCSSDLQKKQGMGSASIFWIIVMAVILLVLFSNRGGGRRFRGGRAPVVLWGPGLGGGWRGGGGFSGGEIGRASGRERVCQYVSISVVAVPFKQKRITINYIKKDD